MWATSVLANGSGPDACVMGSGAADFDRQQLQETAVSSRRGTLLTANVVMLVGGVVGGTGGFAYHAIAARMLWPVAYGEVASLIAVYTIAMTPTQVLTLILAHDAATLTSRQDPGGVRLLVLSAGRSLILPCVAVIALGIMLAAPVAGFLRLGAPMPVVILGIVVAATWLLAVPHGALQGIQRFTALSANLSSEMVVRSLSLVPILLAGFAVSGAMAALLAGALFSLCLGVGSLRGMPSPAAAPVYRQSIAGPWAAATAATVGVLMLFNLDVILAKHYLAPNDAGIYAGLNKLGSIVYFLTLSVSQVMFPKVVAYGTAGGLQGRVLLQSMGALCLLAVLPMAAFAAAPSPVVRALFGPGFASAVPLAPLAGLIGFGVSCVNLAVQFFVAVRDRWFIPLLVSGCALEVALIAVHHDGVAAIVRDVLVAIFTLLLLLVVRVGLLQQCKTVMKLSSHQGECDEQVQEERVRSHL